jgi:hypothetical protein
MYDSVAPKSSLEDVRQACRRNDITLFARNGRAISRVQAVAQSRHAPTISRGKIIPLQGTLLVPTRKTFCWRG